MGDESAGVCHGSIIADSVSVVLLWSAHSAEKRLYADCLRGQKGVWNVDSLGECCLSCTSIAWCLGLEHSVPHEGCNMYNNSIVLSRGIAL
jgi:hypothetical protein